MISHHLKNHYKSHSDSRPYYCSVPYCKMSFKSNYARRNHEKKHVDTERDVALEQSSFDQVTPLSKMRNLPSIKFHQSNVSSIQVRLPSAQGLKNLPTDNFSSHLEYRFEIKDVSSTSPVP